MKKNLVVTVGRQFGSGGRIIGTKIATHFGAAFYDKELLNRASSESGISGEFFERMDEKKQLGGAFSAFSMGFLSSGVFAPGADYLSSESLFGIQSETIQKVVTEGNCVIVGRCADYILRDYPNRIDIFISANMPDRICRIMERTKSDEHQAISLIDKIDKSRAAYYNYYTDKIWGAASSYHLCINSSLYGIEETSNIIFDFIQRKIAEK